VLRTEPRRAGPKPGGSNPQGVGKGTRLRTYVRLRFAPPALRQGATTVKAARLPAPCTCRRPAPICCEPRARASSRRLGCAPGRRRAPCGALRASAPRACRRPAPICEPQARASSRRPGCCAEQRRSPPRDRAPGPPATSSREPASQLSKEPCPRGKEPRSSGPRRRGRTNAKRPRSRPPISNGAPPGPRPPPTVARSTGRANPSVRRKPFRKKAHKEPAGSTS